MLRNDVEEMSPSHNLQILIELYNFTLKQFISLYTDRYLQDDSMDWKPVGAKDDQVYVPFERRRLIESFVPRSRIFSRLLRDGKQSK
ncbi:hypothetical protein D3C84_1198530 [compost metagenome]